MKTIYNIARNELCNLFYSPIAWLILVIFTFQAGMTFSDLINAQIKDQLSGLGLYNITSQIYSGFRGLYTILQSNLYLYIPLLTMSLMSREMSSGSIKLLYSSPITNSQIILGKYLSIMIYNLILISIVMVYVIFGYFTIKDVDYALPLSGFLGLYLMICAYGAIGLMMSTLTSYQVVAAVSTLSVLAVLNFVGRIGQEYAFVRDITYWLSIGGRANQMIDGLICSEDLLYFCIVIIMFISLSILKLQAEREKRSKISNIVRYSTVVALALFCGYLSSRPKLMSFVDVTQTQSRTLSPGSLKVMEKMDGGLAITTYVNLLEKNAWIALPRNVIYDNKRFSSYTRFKPETKMKYVYYYDKAYNPQLDNQYPGLNDEERAREICRVQGLDFKMFLSPEEIRKIIDLRPERNKFVRLLERENGQKTFLRMYDDNMVIPEEKEISAALKRLAVKSPRISFVCGHGERNIYKGAEWDYAAFTTDIGERYALINQGFSPDTISLDKDIPSDVDGLVLADVKNNLSQEELQRINNYIAAGGNLLITGEPGMQDVMNTITESLGVKFIPGILVQDSVDYDPSVTAGIITDEAAQSNPLYKKLQQYKYVITMPRATGLEYSTDKGFKVCPLLVTSSDKYWNELETKDFVGEKIKYNPGTGEVQKAYAVALSLEREVNGKQQHIVIFGDADFMSNGELTRTRTGLSSSNYSMIMEIFKTFSNGEFPVDTSRPNTPDNAVYLGLEATTWIKITTMGIIPLAIMFAGIMLWLKRRKR